MTAIERAARAARTDRRQGGRTTVTERAARMTPITPRRAAA
ncbi:hypothetical protein AB0F46_00855 [Streptomyces sp. NPDC026665]